MALRENLGFLIVVCAAAGAVGTARADEAYLCGPDKIVYVKTEELEFKKRTDPCIASYYGLKVEDAADTPAAESGKTPKTTVGKTAPAITLKKSVALEKPVKEAPQQQAALQPAAAAPGTDYRHVRVINAASQDEGWFYHAR